MESKTNEKKGYLSLVIKKDNYPIIVYRKDENGKPVLKEGDILFINYFSEISRDPYFEYNLEEKIKLSFNGDNYQILRSFLLIGDYKDQLNESGISRTKLSEKDFYELKEVVNQKLKRLRGETLEEIVKWPKKEETKKK